MRWLALVILAGCPGDPEETGDPPDTGPACTWTEVWTGDAGVTLEGIGGDASTVLAVGKDDQLRGMVLRGNSAGFSADTPAIEFRAELNAVAVDGGLAVAVGARTEGFDDPAQMAWVDTGSGWTDAGLTTPGILRAVGVAGGVAVAAGTTTNNERGLALRYDGSWVDTDFESKTTDYPVFGAASRSADDVVLVGHTFSDEAAIWEFDGTAFDTTFPGGDALRGVWTDGSATWAVGVDGVVLELDGTDWVSNAPGTTEDLHGVSGAGGAVFAVGDQGVLARHDGSKWERFDAPIGDPLLAVHAVSADEAYAVTTVPLGSAVWHLACD
jgi:hypothetical protein